MCAAYCVLRVPHTACLRAGSVVGAEILMEEKVEELEQAVGPDAVQAEIEVQVRYCSAA